MFTDRLFMRCIPVAHAMILVSTAGNAFAQTPGATGLATQRPPVAEMTRPASAPKKPSAPPNAHLSVLTDSLGVQHSARDGVGRIVFTTGTTFTTAQSQRSATTAATSVQRGLAMSCGSQCKPEKMAPPKFLPSGQLEFELVFRPLYTHLTQAQFVAALQSQPLDLTPAQMTASPPAAAESTPARETATRQESAAGVGSGAR